MSEQSIMDLVLKFEDDMRDAVREQERMKLIAVAELRNELADQRAEAVANAKTATDFMQKNEALRAEISKFIERIAFLEQQLAAANQVHFANRKDIEAKNYELNKENDALRAENSKLIERIALLETKLTTAKDDTLRGIYASNDVLRAENFRLRSALDSLRAENNEQDAKIGQARVELSNLRDEYNNRGQIIQDFAKREHAHQEKIVALEKLLKEFFPDLIIPAPWDEKPTMSIPQGEWVLRSNEALRNRIVELGRQCELTEETARQWQKNYEHQMAVNARQRSRIAELRLRLNRIRDAEASCQWMAAEALGNDDRIAERPITNILTQEAK